MEIPPLPIKRNIIKMDMVSYLFKCMRKKKTKAKWSREQKKEVINLDFNNSHSLYLESKLLLPVVYLAESD